MKNRLKKLCILLSLVCVFSMLPMSAVAAPTNASPAFELKFLLDSDVVLKNGVPRDELVELFDISSSHDRLVEYIDTTDRAFDAEGWVNRLRVKTTRTKDMRFELTLRKRYAVQNLGSGMNWEAMQAALDTARADGFDSASPYVAEIDWGYDKATLSFSWENNVYREDEYAGYSVEFGPPTPEDAFKMIYDNMLPNQKAWQGFLWAKNLMKDAYVYGPVYYKRYMGEFAGAADDELVLEVWPVWNEFGDKKEYITEVSIGVEAGDDAYAIASELRAKFLKILQEAKIDGKAILVPGDGLKTGTVLERYGPLK